MEKFEKENLASYAVLSNDYERGGGVQKHDYRTIFQRDRDRILHSKAFRRLEYKTQVFATEVGDHLRTRLTHSLEVYQLSQTVAKILDLNCDVVEAISLGHDLGHAPFGHAGEGILNELIVEDTGEKCFKHNIQSIRILKFLEKKYHKYEGLKISIPVLEGILKHTNLPENIPDYCKGLSVDIPHSVTLEGQIVEMTDEIAQMTHDLDDYLRFGIIDIDELVEFKIFDSVNNFYKEKYDYNIKKKIFSSKNHGKKRKGETFIRCLVDYLVTKLAQDSEEIIYDKEGIEPFKLSNKLIKFNSSSSSNSIKKFKKETSKLIENNYVIGKMDERGEYIIRCLYEHYKEAPENLPSKTKRKYKNAEDKKEELITIVDFIAGMTDRFALEKYNEIFQLR